MHTLQEVADQLGLTRERIRQIEAVAKNKLLRLLAGLREDFDTPNLDQDE
ncbi:MAG: sigma factor-like helix-turn-helix DNA-binding protein [Gemmataceae bacterium]